MSSVLTSSVGFSYKAHYNHSFKGFKRDSGITLRAKVSEDMKRATGAILSATLLELFAGDLRYNQMLGIDIYSQYVTAYYFNWYRWLSGNTSIRQARTILWMYDPEEMEEVEMWETLDG